MPSKRSPPTQQPPSSPTSKAGSQARYTNKDGSKFITVPKSTPSPPAGEASQPTAAAAADTTNGATATAPSTNNGPVQPVNRKKAKRRAKAAAKLAAEQAAANGVASSTAEAEPAPSTNGHAGDGASGEAADQPSTANGRGAGPAERTEAAEGRSKSRKNKKKKAGGNQESNSVSDVAQSQDAPRRSGISKEKIWNTSSNEERERIKEFWLGLGEEERKSLVKVEKDAVLKKMKEQQKQTCSCHVCGRRKTAIEEELEGLYDAYYEELEQYANHPATNGPPMLGDARAFGSDAPGDLSSLSARQPSRGRIVDGAGDDERDAYDDSSRAASEDALSDEVEVASEPDYASDFFTFGNSLTVQGGILTVADDLLQNDGRKFIEMMEQLAERRMAREEETRSHYGRGYGHGANGHSHHPMDDEDDYDEDEEPEDDYESQDDDFEDDDEPLNDEQRMEEGRRMFQIFAARLFEQRVLTAYREKVAKERQQKLIEELEEESLADMQRKAKKAKEAQKRKDKAQQKKLALAEEKAKKEAEKAAEEEARLEAERKKAEEARLRNEEKRKKKEAQKRAEEEERLRKEAERLRLREKQAEQERKAREAKEREKKLKEEQRRKEAEARERKEKEARERKLKEEAEKAEKAKAERELKEKQRQERKTQKVSVPVAAAVPANPAKQRPVRQPTASGPAPALPQTTSSVSTASPQVTPAVPKAPTPMRPKAPVPLPQEPHFAPSYASQSGSAPSQNASPHPLTPVHTSPVPSGGSAKAAVGQPGAVPGLPQSTSPIPTGIKMMPSLSSGGIFGQPGIHPPPGIPMASGFQSRVPSDSYTPPTPPFRPPPGMVPPPGLGLPARTLPFGHPPPGFGQAVSDPHPLVPERQTHSRQGSSGFDGAKQPIGHGVIGRPGSVHPGGRSDADSMGQVDLGDAGLHLGSSALLDDTDDPLAEIAEARLMAGGVGSRPPYGPGTFMEPPYGSPMNPWPSSVQNPFPPPGFGNPVWGGPPPFMTPNPSQHRANHARSVTVRLMLCNICKGASPTGSADGYVPMATIKAQIDALAAHQLPNDHPVTVKEILDICETEGNQHNGGGSFDVRCPGTGNEFESSIRWVPSATVGPAGGPGLAIGSAPVSRTGNVGEIGSPRIGAASVFSPAVPSAPNAAAAASGPVGGFSRG